MVLYSLIYPVAGIDAEAFIRKYRKHCVLSELFVEQRDTMNDSHSNIEGSFLNRRDQQRLVTVLAVLAGIVMLLDLHPFHGFLLEQRGSPRLYSGWSIPRKEERS